MGGQVLGVELQVFQWTTLKPSFLKADKKISLLGHIFFLQMSLKGGYPVTPHAVLGGLEGFLGSGGGQEGQMLMIRASKESLIIVECNSTKKKIRG